MKAHSNFGLPGIGGEGDHQRPGGRAQLSPNGEVCKQKRAPRGSSTQWPAAQRGAARRIGALLGASEQQGRQEGKERTGS